MSNTFYFKDLVYIRPINNKWEVEYESYFNPHATPKQLMDKRVFDALEDALEWSKEYIRKNFFDDEEEFIITSSDAQYDPSVIIIDNVKYED